MAEKKPITKEPLREIIEDFANEIKANASSGPKPSKAVIFFRNERENNVERNVKEVPINILRFRKDNGRITSDVLSYEKNYGTLLESDEVAQETLRNFLIEKDPEKTNELVQSIRQLGQLSPAIITADGFLINGNRRKVALEKLYEKEKSAKWQRMKVVILPGIDESGGPPTLKEIEQVENRYQLQSEGKSEYTLFDRALSIRRKISYGVPIEEQLKDDPSYAYLEEREFKQAVKNFKQDFLDPLDKIDRYLDYLDRPALYSTISTGPGDREGRWQSFLDYSKVYRNLSDPKYRWRRKILISEAELGDVEEIAFKLIRKRQFPQLPKVHQIIRDLPKYLGHQEAKDELFGLLPIDLSLPESDCFDQDGNEYDERTKDSIWGEKHATELIRQVKKAKDLYERRRDKETPIKLLEEALKSLGNKRLLPNLVPDGEIEKALILSDCIEKRANELKKEFYKISKK